MTHGLVRGPRGCSVREPECPFSQLLAKLGRGLAVLEELVLEVLCIDTAAACAAMELSRYPFHIFDWAVDGDYVWGFAIFSKGQVVWVLEVGDV